MWLIEQRWAEGVGRAARVLAREGLAGTPSAVLAEAMYRSVGGLYRNFGSKVGVARAVVTHADAALSYQLDLAAALTEDDEGFRGVLKSVWQAALAFAEADPDLFFYAELHWRHPKGTEAGVDDGATRTAECLEALLAEGMATGQLKQLPTKTVRALFWGALTQVVKDLAAGVPCDPDEAFEILWRAVAAAPGEPDRVPAPPRHSPGRPACAHRTGPGGPAAPTSRVGAASGARADPVIGSRPRSEAAWVLASKIAPGRRSPRASIAGSQSGSAEISDPSGETNPSRRADRQSRPGSGAPAGSGWRPDSRLEFGQAIAAVPGETPRSAARTTRGGRESGGSGAAWASRIGADLEVALGERLPGTESNVGVEDGGAVPQTSPPEGAPAAVLEAPHALGLDSSAALPSASAQPVQAPGVVPTAGAVNVSPIDRSGATAPPPRLSSRFARVCHALLCLAFLPPDSRREVAGPRSSEPAGCRTARPSVLGVRLPLHGVRSSLPAVGRGSP